MRITNEDTKTNPPYTFENLASSPDQFYALLNQYTKDKIFHNFYYSVQDVHGRDRIPSVTMDYFEVVADNHRLYPACGWWEKPIAPTVGDPTDPDRFIDCTSYYYP